MPRLTFDRSPVLTHLPIDRVEVESPVRNLFPLVSAIAPKIGIPLRAVTDLTTVGLGKNAFSLLSTYTLFLEPNYFKIFESARSFIKNAEEGYHIGCEDKKKLFQAACHTMADATNIGLYFYKDSLHLRTASFALQLMAGMVDIKDAYDEGSKLKMGVQGTLNLMRAVNLATSGHKLLAIEGDSLTGLKTVSLKQVSDIVSTLRNIAEEKEAFYQSSGLDEIKVVGDSVKFVDLTLFKTPTSWTGCADLYRKMEYFFTALVSKLPDAARWQERLKKVFTQSASLKEYDKSPREFQKEIDPLFKFIFTTDLLKSTLQRLQEMFSGQ